MDRTSLTTAYWHYRAMSTSNDRADRLRAFEFSWVVDAVDSYLTAPGSEAIELLCDLADSAAGVDELAYLGAGPIEDLLHGRSVDLGDEIEIAARRNGNFATAMRCAWFDNDVEPELAARLRSLVGDPL